VKYIFTAICFLFIVDSAICQTNDTTVSYYKNYPGNAPQEVLSADNADFVRVVYPDSSANIYNVLEYYNNGTKKFIGKVEGRPDNGYSLQLVGDCIGFFANGKKKYTAHFTDNRILGMEYFFYPNGRLYAVKKWVYNNPLFNNQLFWECYDNNGNKICENGNGSWLTYNADFSDVIFSGKVKKGFMNGEWKGYDILEDTVKYTGMFNMGDLTFGAGYDKKGAAHPFKNFNLQTGYKRGGLFAFLDDLNRHLILPKDATGKKMDIDTVHISFVIEKDGRLDELKQLGTGNDQLQAALNDAVKKCGEWTPYMYYGMPYRSSFITLLKPKVDLEGPVTIKMVNFKGTLMISNKKANADSAQPN